MESTAWNYTTRTRFVVQQEGKGRASHFYGGRTAQRDAAHIKRATMSEADTTTARRPVPRDIYFSSTADKTAKVQHRRVHPLDRFRESLEAALKNYTLQEVVSRRHCLLL